MHHIDAVGSNLIYKQLQGLQTLRGERFTPDPGWQLMTQSSEGAKHEQ